MNMSDELKLVYFRVSKEQWAKLERMRAGSGRSSIQNVIEVLVAIADETAPMWNIVELGATQASNDEGSDTTS
jgi:hypothetical protein